MMAQLFPNTHLISLPNLQCLVEICCLSQQPIGHSILYRCSCCKNQNGNKSTMALSIVAVKFYDAVLISETRPLRAETICSHCCMLYFQCVAPFALPQTNPLLPWFFCWKCYGQNQSSAVQQWVQRFVVFQGMILISYAKGMNYYLMHEKTLSSHSHRLLQVG